MGRNSPCFNDRMEPPMNRKNLLALLICGTSLAGFDASAECVNRAEYAPACHMRNIFAPQKVQSCIDEMCKREEAASVQQAAGHAISMANHIEQQIKEAFAKAKAQAQQQPQKTETAVGTDAPTTQDTGTSPLAVDTATIGVGTDTPIKIETGVSAEDTVERTMREAYQAYLRDPSYTSWVKFVEFMTEDDAPKELRDPITLTVMMNPVRIEGTNHVFEKGLLDDLIASHKKNGVALTIPMTKQPLDEAKIKPDTDLKAKIQAAIEKKFGKVIEARKP